MLPVSSDLIESIKRAAFPGENIFGGFGPFEGLGPLVVVRQIVVDRGLEIVDAGIAAAPDAFHGDLGEEALDEVHPGRAGGGEMQLEAGMFLEPRPHLGRLVGRVRRERPTLDPPH